MKKLFFAAAVAAAFLSAPRAQAQTVKSTNTSVAPATDGWNWPQVQPEWTTPATAVATETAPETAPETAADDAMMHSSGVMIAPGMSSSPYRGVSTDYNGRPVARGKSYRPRSVRTTSTDPMMASSGVMLAPGMNTAPHRGVSTDYNGHPLAMPASVASPATPTTPNDSWASATW
ncbi:hypothetical protein CDA63_18485 [Hymenobacter amundsenii]|uniref:Uncharacterized protein n=1 Tax=Hymenobacter amundsenii TaxID=2006685 RepID=A0A246FGD2_9BACT|nr:hypothetical protein [Hymenobacter amundsenii]OWP61603.1 hypothetical protein CDA63_18485 [Hymenobacter amundsenii]